MAAIAAIFGDYENYTRVFLTMVTREGLFPLRRHVIIDMKEVTQSDTDDEA
jgi:hypothetical protein